MSTSTIGCGNQPCVRLLLSVMYNVMRFYNILYIDACICVRCSAMLDVVRSVPSGLCWWSTVAEHLFLYLVV